jgi:hypothetical protein
MKKHILDFDLAVTYFYEHIKCGHTLSKCVLNKIDLTSGHFFTVLPEDANFGHIENLKFGGILPNTEVRKPHPSGSGSYQKIPNTKEALVQLMLEYLDENPANYCVAEDVIRRANDKGLRETDTQVLTYAEEVYYLLDQGSSVSEIEEAIWSANAIYHMLIVLAKGDHDFNGHLESEDFKLICEGICCVIGSAYDSESYLIWEKE